MKKEKDIEMMYCLSGAEFNVFFEPETVPEDMQNEILDFVDSMSKEIWIDRSYVNCKHNKHQDTFLQLEGWRALKQLLLTTNYGKMADQEQHDTIVEICNVMCAGYVYSLILKMYPEYASHIGIEKTRHSEVSLQAYEDTTNSWDKYPGKWQTWKIFN